MEVLSSASVSWLRSKLLTGYKSPLPPGWPVISNPSMVAVIHRVAVIAMRTLLVPGSVCMLPKLLVTATLRSRAIAPSTAETEMWGLHYIGLPETVQPPRLVIQISVHPALKPELSAHLFRNSVF